MPEQYQTFLINIAIIEGRHYIWPNMNSAVLVKVDNKKKWTAVKHSSDSPYYNEYFVFEFTSTLDSMLDKNVTITVIRPGGILRKRKILGCTSFDVATVWYQKGHQLYHKWAILTSPNKEISSTTRGYLKLDVGVLSKGEHPKIPTVYNTDEIEGNLFLPHGITRERQRVHFIFDLYRGANFVKKNAIQENAKKPEYPPTSLIRISFSGNQVKSSSKKHSFEPVWNQRLVLPELFPPLCQRFKIEVLHGETVRATRYLNLRSISNDKEEGFLPTFGPAFLHFYSPNHLEGSLGKVLISLRTNLLGELTDYDTKVQLMNQEAPLIREDFVLNHEDIVLVSVVFDVSFFSKKFSDKTVSFRIACGPLYTDETRSKTNSSVLRPFRSVTINRNHSFLSFEGKKPCLFLTVSLPDARKRMFNYNMLIKILKNLKLRLDKIEDIFQNADYNIASTEAEVILMDTLDFITSATKKYLDIASNYKFRESLVLEQKRLRMCLKQMESIILMSKSIEVEQNTRKFFQKLENVYAKIEALIDDIEDWPRVYLWMICDNKRVAYHIMDAKEILHSPVDEEKGEHCGILRSIYFQTEDNHGVQDFVSGVCKMDIMSWMGLSRHLNSFLADGFEFSAEPIPLNFIAQEEHRFEGRVYIFQGRVVPGADKSGLCDPFVQFIVGNQMKQTEIFKKTLHPVWDQTLIFQNITLYGTRDFLAANPPSIIAEVYDKDECMAYEFLGRCILTPTMKIIGARSTFPKLSWQKTYNKFYMGAEILVAVELIEVQDYEEIQDSHRSLIKIPDEIKPKLVNHRIEVVFWGVRNLKKVQLMQINKPKIVIQCVDITVISETLTNFKKSQNFTSPLKMFDTLLPEQHEYAPPLRLKLFDSRSFGISVFAGIHVVPMTNFFYRPYTAETRSRKLLSMKEESLDFTSSIESLMKHFNEKQNVQTITENRFKSKWQKFLQCLCFRKMSEEKALPDFDEPEESTEDFDWWTKFYATLEVSEETPVAAKTPIAHKYKLKVYPSELESQPEFGGFTDYLSSFAMYKGKRTGDEAVDSENTTGIFKGAIRIYKWPLNENYVTVSGLPLEKGVFQDFPSNVPMQFVLRVYCIRGLKLRPKDLNGTSDPYLHLILNQQIIDDRENCIMGETNPVFGKCFEFNGTFPQDHELKIAVLDWDALGSNDLIGETVIDLENRYFTRHRAHCGLAQDYLTSDYCRWRDQLKPLSILVNLCTKWNVPDLEFGEAWVKVASRIFQPENFTPSDNVLLDRQILALEALKHWSEIPLVGCHLVPEHVETRSLFHPQKPGIEQGKLQLWIDILPRCDLPTPIPVNITPRQATTYELRVVVWNAEKIKLCDDELFTGEKKSDIFIKGWMISADDCLYTDVHYRSLTGEANFNWRFIFQFDYLSNENKIVVKTKLRFGMGDQEQKMPCQLTLQAWDNDIITPNDFLGSLTLELSKFHRGAGSVKTCDLSLLDPKVPTINLFKTKRSKGWWPLKSVDESTNREIFAGAIELEFDLLMKEEADKSPVGLAREEPHALSRPNRPDSSFSWFRSPWKAVKYIAKANKCLIFKVVLFLILVFVIFAGIYSFPQLALKKILRV